jgi:hypothetical protein
MRKQAIPIEKLPGEPVMKCGWSWTGFFFTLFAFTGLKSLYLILFLLFVFKWLVN